MKILLFGKNGQVGWELQRALAPLGELIALDRSRDQGLCGDLSHLDDIRRTIRQIKPNIVVNAAAYTAVDKAESDQALAMKINAAAPAVLAEESAAIDALLIHYSTDYVFDGRGVLPWQETDAPAPLNVYGESKLRGEQAIQASSCRYLIFRTSWVYGVRGKHFARTILQLARERSELKIVEDQIGAPTSAELLADVTAHAIRMVAQDKNKQGLYHVAAAGEISWYEYAQFIVNTALEIGERLQVRQILPILSEAYRVPAKRPLNSRLNTDKLQHAFQLCLPCWKIGAVRMLKEFLE